MEKFIKLTGFLTNWSIYLLLFLLGLSVGANEKIIANFDKIDSKPIATTMITGNLKSSMIGRKTGAI